MVEYEKKDFSPKGVKQVILSNNIKEIEIAHSVLFAVSQNMDLKLGAIGEIENSYIIVFYTTEDNYEILFPIIKEIINEKILKVA